MKKALIIVPSDTTDSPCCEALRAALTSSGYEVTLLTGFVQQQSDDHYSVAPIQEASLIVCEVTGKTAHVFYYLGSAHALGKRVLVLSESPSDILSCTGPGENLVCNRSDEHWEEELSQNLARALAELEASQPIPWGQGVRRDEKRPFIRWALSNEIKFNLSALERVRAKDLIFLGVWHPVDRGSLLIVNCETDAFESEDVRRALERQKVTCLGALLAVYDGFYNINQKAGIADNEFSAKTAQEYLQAVREFENSLMDGAQDLIEQLVAKGL